MVNGLNSTEMMSYMMQPLVQDMNARLMKGAQDTAEAVQQNNPNGNYDIRA